MNKEKFESIGSFGVYVWLLLIVASLSVYAIRPELFEPASIRLFFSENLVSGLFVYFLINTLRTLSLIPSTPFVLAGILVFPPLPLFLVNQAAIYSSSALLYLLTRTLRFDHFFFTHYPRQVERLITLLHKRELSVISLWGFAPFIPTDMIVCICSVLRISMWKTLLGVSIGEGIICAIYIFGGAAGLQALLHYWQI